MCRKRSGTASYRNLHRNLEVTEGEGTLTAEVDDTAIESGAEVEHDKDVVFTATPADGYRVKGWTLNNEAVAGNTTNNFTVEDL